MKIKPLLVPAAVFLLLALASCGDSGNSSTTTGGEIGSTATSEPGGNGAAPSGEAERSAKVKIVEFAYDPDPVTVQVGGKVSWQNEDSVPHTATAEDGSFDTGTLAPGKLKSETFKQAGTYAYICEIHPTMHGTVEVVEKQ